MDLSRLTAAPFVVICSTLHTDILVTLASVSRHISVSKVRALESEVEKRKTHEEFYIDKAREWKNRALKYERKLEQHGLPVPGKENREPQQPQPREEAPR